MDTFDVIQIGNHCWFAENLRTEYYSNGSPIPFIDNLNEWSDLDEYPYAQTIYDFNDSLLSDHGRLYTWYAAYSACPAGWGLGNDMEEWFLLEQSAGMPITEVEHLVSRRG